MKKLTIIIFFLALFSINCATTRNSNSRIDWCAYCQNLKFGLELENPELQRQVLRRIIDNMKQLNMAELVQPLYRLTQTSTDTEVRDLAELALHKTRFVYGTDYLKINLQEGGEGISEAEADKLLSNWPEFDFSYRSLSQPGFSNSN